MKTKLYLLVIAILTAGSLVGQVSTQLANVTEGSPNNSAGLGVTFTNRLMPDGDLYFRGSKDGLTESIWRTDGTVAGTRKVIEEGSAFGGNWSSVFFVEDGVLLQGSNGYKMLSDDDNQLSSFLSQVPDEFLRDLTRLENGNYTFATKPADVLNLYITNSDFTEVTEVEAVHPDGSELVAYSGNEGVLIYNGNSFQESSPVVYEYESQLLTPLADYMATYGLSLSDLSEGYVYSDYMFLSYRDADNFFRDHVINMATGAVAEFTFLRAPYTVHEYGDDLVFVASRDAVLFNTTDLSHQSLYNDVFALGTSAVVGDKLYFIAENDSDMEQIVESDLTTGTSRFLPGAVTGRFFYNCKMLEYEGEFYYLSEGEHVLLQKYDFATDAPVFVDSLSIVTGATVRHDIKEVGGELVFSKRLGFQQHEPFVLGNGGTTSTSLPLVEELVVVPTVASDMIRIAATQYANSNIEVQLCDASGQSFGTMPATAGQLSIGHLPAGKYYGITMLDGVPHKLSFIKI